MSKPESELRIIPAAACTHLRSKNMYVTGQTNPADDYETHGDGYCWCNKTAGQYGPDDQFVERTTCQSGRNCYETIL